MGIELHGIAAAKQVIGRHRELGHLQRPYRGDKDKLRDRRIEKQSHHGEDHVHCDATDHAVGRIDPSHVGFYCFRHFPFRAAFRPGRHGWRPGRKASLPVKQGVFGAVDAAVKQHHQVKDEAEGGDRVGESLTLRRQAAIKKVHPHMGIELHGIDLLYGRKSRRRRAHGGTLGQVGYPHQEQPGHGEEYEEWKNPGPQQAQLLRPAHLAFLRRQRRAQMRLELATDGDVNDEKARHQQAGEDSRQP